MRVIEFPKKNEELQEYLAGLRNMIEDPEISGIAVALHYKNGDVNVTGWASSGDLLIGAALMHQWGLATLAGEE